MPNSLHSAPRIFRPAGAKLRERDIEAALVARVKYLGGEIRKVKWIGRNFAPDRVVMLSGWPTIWVELKAPKKKPTPGQAKEHQRMRAAGQIVVKIDTLAQIDELFPIA